MIPGSPVAYWVNDTIKKAFSKTRLSDYAQTKQGFATGDNDKFLRLWFEVGYYNSVLVQQPDYAKGKITGKWFPCNKGGTYRKWYGNNTYVANWKHDGLEMSAFKGSVIRNPQFYFKEGITWSSLANQLSLRYSPVGYVFESKGSMCFVNRKENISYILALLNSKITATALSILSPTLDFHEGPMLKVPVVISNKDTITELANENITISRTDWDAFETSWDFKAHRLVTSRLWMLPQRWRESNITTVKVQKSVLLWRRHISSGPGSARSASIP